MKPFATNCVQIGRDRMEVELVHNTIYFETVDGFSGGKNCLAMNPTQARELAVWLEQAAIEAEQADES